MLGEQTQKISLNYYCRPTFAISKLKITLWQSSSLQFSFILILFCIIVNKLYVIAVIWEFIYCYIKTLIASLSAWLHLH